MQLSLNMCQKMDQNHIGRCLDKHFGTLFCGPRSVSYVYEDRFKWQRGVNCFLKFCNKLIEFLPT